MELIVKNLGPVKTAEMEIRKVTVLSGPTGAGKSALMRVCFAFQWLEKAVCSRRRSREWAKAHFLDSVLEHAGAGHLVEDDRTEMAYRGDFLNLSFSKGHLDIRLSRKRGSYSLPKILVIPSERAFLSVVESSGGTRDLSYVMSEFVQEYTVAVNALGDKLHKLPIGDFLLRHDRFSGVSTIFDSAKTWEVPLPLAPSGVQSSLPMSLTCDHWLQRLEYKLNPSVSQLSLHESNRIREIAEKHRFAMGNRVQGSERLARVMELAKVYGRAPDEEAASAAEAEVFQSISSRLAIFVEEPEQNLYPSAQKAAIEHLVASARGKGSLFLTTHSPHVLSTLNDMVRAGEPGAKHEGANPIEPDNCQLFRREVSAYHIEDGVAEDIPGKQSAMMDTSRHGGSPGETGKALDSLLKTKRTR